jgi:hypothetical protein
LALQTNVSISELNSTPLKHLDWQVWLANQEIEKFLDSRDVNEPHFCSTHCCADFGCNMVHLQMVDQWNFEGMLIGYMALLME